MPEAPCRPDCCEVAVNMASPSAHLQHCQAAQDESESLRPLSERRYHTVEVPLTLRALSGVPGQPLLTALPGAFVAVRVQQLLTPAQVCTPDESRKYVAGTGAANTPGTGVGGDAARVAAMLVAVTMVCTACSFTRAQLNTV